MNNSNNLAVIKSLTQTIDLISETLFLLQDKRVTLEEKMIRKHLHELAEKLALTVASIHSYFKSKDYDIDKQVMNDIDNLAIEIQTVVSELLKIVNYNWNFLEQYFEYNFFAKLTNEYKFINRLDKLLKSIEIKT